MNFPSLSCCGPAQFKAQQTCGVKVDNLMDLHARQAQISFENCLPLLDPTFRQPGSGGLSFLEFLGMTNRSWTLELRLLKGLQTPN